MDPTSNYLITFMLFLIIIIILIIIIMSLVLEDYIFKNMNLFNIWSSVK